MVVQKVHEVNDYLEYDVVDDVYLQYLSSLLRFLYVYFLHLHPHFILQISLFFLHLYIMRGEVNSSYTVIHTAGLLDYSIIYE